MAQIDKLFKETLQQIYQEGFDRPDRTGTGTRSVQGVMIRHQMQDGFPLLTLRKMPYKAAFVEMEGFIRGVTNKAWYQNRGCHFWDHWCSPDFVPFQTYPKGSPEEKERMRDCNGLGPIYGYQWRNFGDRDKKLQCDQLKTVVDTLKSEPTSRRMVCSAWNPVDLSSMALPPCHVLWQVTVTGHRLNLFYYQRSCDFVLGNNLTGYGLLLMLLAKETNLIPGVLTAFFADCHVYHNHIEGVSKLLKRSTEVTPPKLEFKDWDGIFNWTHDKAQISDYFPITPSISFPVSV